MWVALQEAARRASQRLLTQAHTMATLVADRAARNGNAKAAEELRALGRRFDLHPRVFDLVPHDVNASRLIAADLENRLTAAAARITRFADDAYRATTVSATLEQILGTRLGKATPAEAQAQAWRELTAKGVTGFTDNKGRDWNLATYVEMATRTAVQKAYNTSHQDRLKTAGMIYFTVNDDARPCPRCAPWQGVILSDHVGPVTEPAVNGTGPVTFTVGATVEEATAAGLFHPNCLHTLISYLPGATLLRPTPVWGPEQEQAYKDTQRLRAMEVQVRKHKQVAEAALTPTARAEAMAKARAVQARIRAFTDETGLARRRRREQLDLGNKP